MKSVVVICSKLQWIHWQFSRDLQSNAPGGVLQKDPCVEGVSAASARRRADLRHFLHEGCVPAYACGSPPRPPARWRPQHGRPAAAGCSVTLLLSDTKLTRFSGALYTWSRTTVRKPPVPSIYRSRSPVPADTDRACNK